MYGIYLATCTIKIKRLWVDLQYLDPMSRARYVYFFQWPLAFFIIRQKLGHLFGVASRQQLRESGYHGSA